MSRTTPAYAKQYHPKLCFSHRVTLLCLRLLTLSVWLAIAPPAMAGAWTQPKGEGMAVLTYLFYYTSQQFSDSWNLQDFPDNGQFHKNELNLYLEYGLTERWTLLGNFFLDALRYQNDFVENNNFGLADQEVGLRYRLHELPPQSLQLIVKIPGPYQINNQPALGNGQTDIELAYYLGTAFQFLGRWGFADAGVGFRLRTGPPADELRWYLTLGWNITENLQIYLLEASGIHGLGNDSPQYVGDNILLTTDFDLIKVGASLLYRFSPNWMLQAGPFWQPAGRATGAGGGFKVALWYDF